MSLRIFIEKIFTIVVRRYPLKERRVGVKAKIQYHTLNARLKIILTLNKRFKQWLDKLYNKRQMSNYTMTFLTEST